MSHPDMSTEPVTVTFTVNEKRRLERVARDFGQTLDEYIRERVLAESSCEEQVLRFLADELAATAQQAEQALARMRSEEDPRKPAEMPQEEADRIVREVRASLKEEELDALARFFKPAFDAGLWPSRTETGKENKP